MTAAIKSIVRSGARVVASGLNQLSGGRITPNAVTYVGFAAHVPIAWCVAIGYHRQAALLLIVFGLFDTLDGELARLQNRSSTKGMLLDASTDRMKEVLLYTGAGYFLAVSPHPATAAWAAAACGASICVSYVKAKGEAAVAAERSDLTHAELNRLFGGGLLSFEVRMAVLVVGLLGGQLTWAVALVAVLASITALQRLVMISGKL